MQAYIIRRLVLAVPTFIGITIFVFLALRMIPGDTVDQMAAGGAITAEGKAQIRQALGLDRPWYTQYASWMGGLLHANLGRSLVSGNSIAHDVGQRFPQSLELDLLAIVVGLLIALPIGVIAALRQGTWLDYAGRSAAITALSIPNFWLATLLLIVPSFLWHVAPALQYQTLFQDPITNLSTLALPVLVLGIGLSGLTLRLCRTQMLEVLSEDYVRTAWAKGLSTRAVVLRHAMRNALLPIVTLIGLQIPFLLGGTVVVEQIFNLPGLGSYLLLAVSQRDYPAIQAVDILIGAVVIVSNLVVDVLYGRLDPRLRSP
ncbi:MAG TPA: ABC transporter permease [Dehalococcoidia bacterium]|nr:ABC transporter permease [Dehalococcoidia bacterium]